MTSLEDQKVLIFIKSVVSVFLFMVTDFCPKISLRTSWLRIFFPTIFSGNFIVLAFMFRSMIHFQLNFMV